MTSNRIGTRAQWLTARAELLEREKEFTRLGDALARQRRELPWVPVEKQYMLQHRRRGTGRWRSCSTAARSWWSTTSCSALITRADVPPALRRPTASTACSPT